MIQEALTDARTDPRRVTRAAGRARGANRTGRGRAAHRRSGVTRVRGEDDASRGACPGLRDHNNGSTTVRELADEVNQRGSVPEAGWRPVEPTKFTPARRTTGHLSKRKARGSGCGTLKDVCRRRDRQSSSAPIDRSATQPPQEGGSSMQSSNDKLTIDDLRSEAFVVSVKVDDLRDDVSAVPLSGGIYVVVRRVAHRRHFSSRAAAGTSKVGIRPRFSMYSRTSGCRTRRCSTSARATCCGVGSRSTRLSAAGPIGHWGGRYIWQLSDSDELLVAWKACGEDELPVTWRRSWPVGSSGATAVCRSPTSPTRAPARRSRTRCSTCCHCRRASRQPRAKREASFWGLSALHDWRASPNVGAGDRTQRRSDGQQAPHGLHTQARSREGARTRLPVAEQPQGYDRLEQVPEGHG